MYSNPNEQYIWGTVANGTATGFFGDLVTDKIDMAIGDISGNYPRHQVCRLSTFIMEASRLTFAAPSPVIKR